MASLSLFDLVEPATDQPLVYTPPSAAWSGSIQPTIDTSRAAAQAIAPTRSHLVAVVLVEVSRGQVAGRHGATCDEIEYCTRLPHQTVSPRIHELMTAKPPRLVPATVPGPDGEPVVLKRKTRSGRRAIVWRRP